MSVNIRYPNITALNEKEQIAQIKSYLHQLVEQLNYALPNLGTGDGATQTASGNTHEVQGGELSYYELRSLIIQDLQKVENLFNQLSDKVDADVEKAVKTALEEAKASGEFDGQDGQDGQNGQDGQDGQDGYTPVKGIDYFTEAEVNSIATQAVGKISLTLDEVGNLYYEVEE